MSDEPTVEQVCSQDSRDVPDVAPIEDIVYEEADNGEHGE